MRAVLAVLVLLAARPARADLATAPTTDTACIDDLLARFMPAVVRPRGGASEAAVVYRPAEWTVHAKDKLDVWLPGGKLGRFPVSRVKKLWHQDGWVVEARIPLPRAVRDNVAVVALPGDGCAARAGENPPFPSAKDYQQLGLEPARPGHLFDFDGDGRPDAFTIENDDGFPHSLFLLDRAARKWVRTDLTDVS